MRARAARPFAQYLLDYPYAERLYPGALDALALAAAAGPTVVLTDGDAVFQPRKVERAGIRDAVDATSSSTSTRRRSSTTSSVGYPADATCSWTTSSAS